VAILRVDEKNAPSRRFGLRDSSTAVSTVSGPQGASPTLSATTHTDRTDDMMTTPEAPAAEVPTNLSPRALAYWERVVAEREDWTSTSLELLHEIAATMSDVDRMQAVLDADGMAVPGSKGQVQRHPLLPELRAQRLLLTRMLAALDPPKRQPTTQSGWMMARIQADLARRRAEGGRAAPADPREESVDEIRERLTGGGRTGREDRPSALERAERLEAEKGLR
jgi:hypothetical protein